MKLINLSINYHWALLEIYENPLIDYQIEYSQLIFFGYIGLVGGVFANGPEDLSSIPARVILKTLKMVLDTSLLNTQQYKVRIKG